MAQPVAKRRTPPDVRRAIQDLAAEGHTAKSIGELLGQDERYADRVPESERTIQAIAREGRLRDGSGRWSLRTADPREAALVLPVMRAVLEHWESKVNRLTNAQAARIAQLCIADAALPPLEAYRLAQRYVAAEQLGKDTWDEDYYIARQLWRDPALEREAFRKGWVNTIRGDLTEKGVDY